MPVRQQTFELIPTSIARAGGARPPMTSKQAKKAYAAKSKAPKMSKAEHARLEKERLEAQRKERDRERAAAKAKAAREKKAAREAEKMNKRRKAGLPLKDVNPSQPTLAAFTMRVPKRTSSEISGQETGSAEEGPVRKKPAVNFEEAEVEGELVEGEQVEGEQVEEEQFEGEQVEEEEFGGLPDISPRTVGTILSSVLDKTTTVPDVNGLLESASQSPKVQRLGKVRNQDCSNTREETCAMNADVQPCSSQKSEDEFGDFPDLSPNELPILLGETEFPSKTFSTHCRLLSGGEQSGIFHARPRSKGPFSATPTLIQKSHNARNSIANNMVPPSIPRLQSRAPLKAVSSNRLLPPARDRSSKLPAAEASKPAVPVTPTTYPPTSSQMFLENNFDDFFPSPSQQVRELTGAVDEWDIPSDTQVAREITSDEQPTHGHVTDFSRGAIPFSTQMLDDFELSSQDFRDIETPSKPATKHAKLVTTIATSAPKRRFFMEKDEDLLYVTIDESRIMAKAKEQVDRETALSKKSQPAPRKATRSFCREPSDSTDYGYDFDTCSQELLDMLAQVDEKLP